jgi:hypothetical protein
MIEIIPKNTFIRAVKPLRKRYPTIEKDIKALLAALQENPTLGIDLGDGLYKIKMLITDKKTGKSGGASVITYFTETIALQWIKPLATKSVVAMRLVHGKIA